jgi:hypothetical protein
LGRDVPTDTGLFSCAAPKHTPFFHTIHVIVAILRATVRRAIAGFIPFAEQGGVELRKGPSGAGLYRRAFEDGFPIMVVVLMETAKLDGLVGSL